MGWVPEVVAVEGSNILLSVGLGRRSGKWRQRSEISGMKQGLVVIRWS